MTRELIEKTAFEWTLADTGRAERALNRLALQSGRKPARSPEEIIDALIRLAGRLDIAATRAW